MDGEGVRKRNWIKKKQRQEQSRETKNKNGNTGKLPKEVRMFSGFKSGCWCACYVYAVIGFIIKSLGTFTTACVFLRVQSKKDVFITSRS